MRKADTVSIPARRGGRPTQLQASQIGEKILDVATTVFLTEGYGSASIETIAKAAGISKRTFYHRFKDKADLFAAVLHRMIERLRAPVSSPVFKGETLEENLTWFAKAMLRTALSPQALALFRMMVSEVTRFPELMNIMDREGARRIVVDNITHLLLEKQSQVGGKLSPEKARFAAEEFLMMVIALPQRRALGLGPALNPAEIEAWGANAVKLFLNGLRGL